MLKRQLFVCLTFACFSWVPAQADPLIITDPLVVTSGSASAYWDSSLSSASLFGEGFSISGNGRGSGPSVWFVGEQGNLDGDWNFSRFDIQNSVSINGVFYSVFLQGGFTATTEPFLVPPPGAPGERVTFSSPFTATGRVQGFDRNDSTQLLFDVAIVGSGIARSTQSPGAGQIEGGFYVNRTGVLYEFAAQDVEPVPEPATMLLVAGGLAGLAIRRRRQGPSSR